MKAQRTPLVTSAASATRRMPSVCVVDPRAEDYANWNAHAQACGVRIEMVGSANAALRLARQQVVDLWVINAELPGLSGCDLCQILRSRSSRTPVLMVANAHTEQLERTAYRAGAKLFGVKPGHVPWLADWAAHHLRQLRMSSPEMRS